MAKAGLQRVYVGLESGSDLLLKKMNKGCTSDDLFRTGIKLGKAGIQMDVSMMLGIGGKEYSELHARETADLINKISPVCVRIRSFTPKENTGLGEDFQKGDFSLMGPHDILRELYLMVDRITSRTQLLSEHWTNFTWFTARMPEEKSALLRQIEKELEQPLEAFRPLGLTDSRG